MSETRQFKDLIGTDSSSVAQQDEDDRDQPVGGRRRQREKYDDAGNRLPSVWGTNENEYWGVPKTHRRIPAGTYAVDSHIDLGAILTEFHLEMDDLIALPNKVVDSTLEEFQKFWVMEPAFRKRGFIHKRGFLFYGPPAGGKTSMVNTLAQRLVADHDGIVIFADEDPQLLVAGLKVVRNIEPTRPLVVVMEEIDAIIRKRGDGVFLSLLDGTAQINHVFFVATTNYPERLDKRLVNRPSRFDTIMHIGMPGAAVRRAYLTAKEPSLSEADLDKWVEASRGFSLAHLKEMIISVFCLGQDIDYVVARLDDMHKRHPSSDEDDTGGMLGFINKLKDDE